MNWLDQFFEQHGPEAWAAIAGLIGAGLLATAGDYAKFGWWAFLASNLGWIYVAAARNLGWLLVQQLGFLCTTLWGIWTWWFA